MTGKHESVEKVRNTERSPGNLGQKKAEEEETADEMLEHMGDDDAQESDKRQKREDKSKKR